MTTIASTHSTHMNPVVVVVAAAAAAVVVIDIVVNVPEGDARNDDGPLPQL